MGNGNVEVSRQRPCPICGKEDWCSFFHPSPGKELVICKRYLEGLDVRGFDGKSYKFKGFTAKEHNARYEDMRQYEAWLSEHGYGHYSEKETFHAKKTNIYGSSVSETETAVPKSFIYEDVIHPKSHKELDQFYRALLSVLVLDKIHADYLIKEGWTRELLQTSLVKSFPVKDVIRFKYPLYPSKNVWRKKLAQKVMGLLGLDNLIGYPGAFVDHAGNWTFNGPSGILLPIYDPDGLIYALRIRMDFCDVSRNLARDDRGVYYYDYNGLRYFHMPFKGFYTQKDGQICTYKDFFYYTDEGRLIEIKGKYRPLTSFFADNKAQTQGIIRNSLEKGCQAPNGISVYFDRHSQDPTFAYFTEGEKKGIYSNFCMGAMTITFPGVSSWGDLFLKDETGESYADKLWRLGVRTCIVAYDADKSVNRHVMNQQENVVHALQEYGFTVGIANWNPKYGKGLDDLLSNGSMPGFELCQTLAKK